MRRGLTCRRSSRSVSSFRARPAATTGRIRRDVVAHIDRLWGELRAPARAGRRAQFVAAPARTYVAGAGATTRSTTDSYFTMLGLLESGRIDLVRSMVANFAAMIERYGHVPNGNPHLLPESLAAAVLRRDGGLLADHDGPGVLATYLPTLEASTPSGWTAPSRWRRAPPPRRAPGRRHPAQPLLGRLRHPATRATSWTWPPPRLSRVRAGVYRNLRAGAESGWDFSSLAGRWPQPAHDPHRGAAAARPQ